MSVPAPLMVPEELAEREHVYILVEKMRAERAAAVQLLAPSALYISYHAVDGLLPVGYSDMVPLK